MKKNATCKIILILILLLWSGDFIFAGNIDPFDDGHKYAWGENIGWINFKPSSGPGVTITNSNVIGAAWGENVGWVLMNPTTGGVVNDGNGNLSGYAWGENVGWISFSCENTNNCGFVNYGVSVDPTTGVFSGKAWGENTGWIVFDYNSAGSYGVKSFWGSCSGDFDLDGDIDGSDLSILINLYNAGNLNSEDLSLFGQNFGSSNCSVSNSIAGRESQQSLLEGNPLVSTNQAMLSNRNPSFEPNISPGTHTTIPETEIQTNTSQMESQISFILQAVTWKSSNGQEGTATGRLEWQINDIILDLGTNMITITVKDAAGNIREKTIEVIYKEILTENETVLSARWVRRFTYEYRFDETYLKDKLTAADLTLYCWPDKIVTVDDHSNFSFINKYSIVTGSFLQERWAIECDEKNENVLFLDIPIEEIMTN